MPPVDSGSGGNARVRWAVPRALLRDRVVLASLLVMAAAVAVKVYVLSRSSFVEDDYLFFGEAYTAQFGTEYLFGLHKGHLMPGALFLVYVQTALWPYNWWISAGTMLVLQVAALVVFLKLLWELFGRRPALLIPFAVYAFAPLTLPVLGWWAAALNAVPFQLAIGLALLWMVRHLRTDDPRYAWQAGAAVVFGMLFSVKALFLPSLLFVVAVAWLYPGSLLRAARNAWMLHRPWWVAMAVLTVGYLVVYLGRQGAGDGSEGAAVPETGPAAELVRRSLTEVFPVGALGGPFEWSPVTPAGGLVDPHGALVVAAWVVLVVLFLAALGVRRRSWRAWALLAGYLVFVDAIPTVIARGRAVGMVGADPRYVADATLIFALCLALAFLAVREERAREYTAGAGEQSTVLPVRRIRTGRALPVVAAVTVVGYVGASTFSAHAYAGTLSGDRLQEYLGNVRASLADAPESGGIYPRPVPEDIVLEWNGDRRLSSYVLPPIADDDIALKMAEPHQAADAYVLDDEGFLVPARPVEEYNIHTPKKGEECLPVHDGLAAFSVWPYGGPQQVVTLGYTSSEDAGAAVVVGEETVDAYLPAAPDGGHWYVPVEQEGDNLGLMLPDDLCLTWVSLGPLVPDTEEDTKEDSA